MDTRGLTLPKIRLTSLTITHVTLGMGGLLGSCKRDSGLHLLETVLGFLVSHHIIRTVASHWLKRVRAQTRIEVIYTNAALFCNHIGVTKCTHMSHIGLWTTANTENFCVGDGLIAALSSLLPLLIFLHVFTMFSTHLQATHSLNDSWNEKHRSRTPNTTNALLFSLSFMHAVHCS